MNFKKMKTIYKKLSKKGFYPTHVAEVGVYYPETSNIYNYIMQNIRCTLVEPDPDSVKRIKEHFSNKKNVTLYPIAIYDFDGKIKLYQRSASTYVSELKNSPAIVNDGYNPNPKDCFTVEAKTFNKIDDGTIDLLSIDTEGSEWFVIKHMVSRPSVISLETHGAIYINPYINEITEWMHTNNYALLYKNKSDSVFIKKDSLLISFLDKIKLIIMNIYLSARMKKKKINRAMKSKRSNPI